MRQGPGSPPTAVGSVDSSVPRPSQADHALDAELGAADQPAPPRRRRRAHRSPALRVIERIPTLAPEQQAVRWEPRPGLPPRGRAECKTGERPCPYIRCKFHLFLVPGAERAGRRWKGRPPPTTVLPAWLEVPTPPCCALDIADAVSAGASDLSTMWRIGELMHMGQTRVHAVIAQALAKLRASGFELADLLAEMAES